MPALSASSSTPIVATPSRDTRFRPRAVAIPTARWVRSCLTPKTSAVSIHNSCRAHITTKQSSALVARCLLTPNDTRPTFSWSQPEHSARALARGRTSTSRPARPHPRSAPTGSCRTRIRAAGRPGSESASVSCVSLLLTRLMPPPHCCSIAFGAPLNILSSVCRGARLTPRFLPILSASRSDRGTVVQLLRACERTLPPGRRLGPSSADPVEEAIQ